MRKLTAVAVALLLVTALLVPTFASAATDYSYIRVKLSSMGSPASVQFKVAGAYRVAEDSSVDLFPGITYTVKAEGTGIKLTYNNGVTTVSHSLPSKVTFVQYTNGTARNFLYVNNPGTGYGWRYYSGNMTFTRASGTSYLQLVNTVYIETYLYGVVAYEMSDDWPTEALKAQAVCARTYAMAQIKSDPSGTYHVVDTSSDQVYKGYPFDDHGMPLQHVIDAVNATGTKALLSGEPTQMNLASGQYSASNGGQIRFTATNDDYDLRNASSPSFTYVFPKSTSTAVMGLLSTNDAAKANTMLALLREKLPQALHDQYGIDCSDSGITINGITAVQPTALRSDSPLGNMPQGSKEFTKLAVTMNVTVSGTPSPAPAAQVRGNNIEIPDGSINTPKSDDNTDFGTAIIDGTPVLKAYTIFNNGNADLVITGITMTGGDSAVFTVGQPTFPLTVKANASADFSISFSPSMPELSQATVSIDSNDANTPYTFQIAGMGATQAPLSPEAPVQQAGPGPDQQQQLATGGGGMPSGFDVVVMLDYVSKAEDGNWDVYGDMRTRFTTYNSLLGTPSLWLLYDSASTDGNFLYVTARGYGHGKGLSQRGAQQMAREERSYADILKIYYSSYAVSPVGIAERALGQIPGKGSSAQWGKVTAATLNVRAAASTNGVLLGTLARNTVVEILGTSGAWYRILRGSTGMVGYVSSQYLAKTSTGPTAAPSPTPSGTASVSPTATPSGTAGPSATPSPVMGRVVSTSLNLRAQANTTSAIQYTLKRGDSVIILDANAAPNWYKVRYLSYTGYCMYQTGTTTYIEIVGALPPGPTPTGTGAPGGFTVPNVVARANVASGSLTLRQTASTTAASMAQIPKGISFTVLQVYTNAAWLKASYSGKTGFVLAKYALIGGNTAYKACTVTILQLNVRNGAGTNYGIIGTLKSGDTVVVTATVPSASGTWYKIQLGSTTGYIDKRYARISTN